MQVSLYLIALYFGVSAMQTVFTLLPDRVTGIKAASDRVILRSMSAFIAVFMPLLFLNSGQIGLSLTGRVVTYGIIVVIILTSMNFVRAVIFAMFIKLPHPSVRENTISLSLMVFTVGRGLGMMCGAILEYKTMVVSLEILALILAGTVSCSFGHLVENETEEESEKCRYIRRA